MTMASSTDSVTVLTGMYAAEAEYLAAGGPDEASFDLLAPFFRRMSCCTRRTACPTAARGADTTA